MAATAPELPPADRQVAHQLSGLSIHGKEEVLPMPLGIQHPDGHQGVMHLAPAQVNAAVSENAEVITLLRSKLLSVNGAVEAQDLLQLAVQEEARFLGEAGLM